MTNSNKEQWDAYVAHECGVLVPILKTLGFTLDGAQPHVQGERYLMQAQTTTSGKKLILLGKEIATGRRIVIKTSRDTAGKAEIEHERKCRAVLQKIRFAYDIFFTPEEILHTKRGALLISIQAFIAQERTFLSRPCEEQFTLALRAFKGQESAHATTYEHARLIRRTFGMYEARDYSNLLESFRTTILTHKNGASVAESLEQAKHLLYEHRDVINQYGSFLTHTDFVPHNFRIVGNNIYLLDYASLRFGNKYEGWARFLNFMTLYNRPLEQALERYVKDNRTPEEMVSLRLMRIFRLCELMSYYTKILEQSQGDLFELNTARLSFWSDVLVATLANTSISDERIRAYTTLRDTLRTADEHERQKNLH